MPECPGCRAVRGHGPNCPHATVAERIEALEGAVKYHADRAERLSSILERWRNQAVLWQGKHALVKHENNRLRAKLYRKQREGEDDGTKG